MSLPERREPTHVLRLEVPLHFEEDAYDFDVFSDVLKLMVGLSRVAYVGAICGDLMATVEQPGQGDRIRGSRWVT